MRSIFNIFYGVFIGLLVLVGVVFLASLTPIKTGIEAKIVKSGSMTPAIPVGALVFIQPSEAYELGDIITFGEDSSSVVPTTHRVVSIRNENGTEFYTTKGDANEETDPREVAKRYVIGKVLFSVPYAGFVLDFARQPLGFALLIGVPAFLVIISELAAIVQELARIRRKRRRLAVTAKPIQKRLPSMAITPNFTHSIEYVRRFAMDDVFIPVQIFEKRVRSIPVHHYAGAISSAVAVLFITTLVSLEGSGGTLSYFRDTEISTGNSFTAAGDFGPLFIEAFSGGEAVNKTLSEEPTSGDVETPDGSAVVENVTEEKQVSEEADHDAGQTREGRENRDERGDRETRENTKTTSEENIIVAEEPSTELPTETEQVTPTDGSAL